MWVGVGLEWRGGVNGALRDGVMGLGVIYAGDVVLACVSLYEVGYLAGCVTVR